MGVLSFVHTEILLTSGPGMTTKTQRMNDRHGSAYTAPKQTDVFMAYSFAQRQRTQVDPISWHAMHLRNSPKVTGTSAHLYSWHIYIYLTSPPPYQRAASPFQTNRHAQPHRYAGVCNGGARAPIPPVQIWTVLTFIRQPWSIRPEL